MNTLEQLTAQDKDNYRTYLDRMSQSCTTSTKHLIPFYTIGCNTVLDVGCADGTLIKAIQAVNPTARVVGIDLNQNAVDLATAAGLEVYKANLKDIGKKLNLKFDCIIFSSVLHEISSYNKEYNFSRTIIGETLALANKSLVEGGRLIIRDGLEDSRFTTNICKLVFAKEESTAWFRRFMKETTYPFYPYTDYTIEGTTILCDCRVAQEFLATYTWGEDSWHREIQEKFCILSEIGWTNDVKEQGFEPIAFMKSKEEYEIYLRDKVRVYDLYGKECFPYMTCTIIAQKKEQKI